MLSSFSNIIQSVFSVPLRLFVFQLDGTFTIPSTPHLFPYLFSIFFYSSKIRCLWDGFLEFVFSKKISRPVTCPFTLYVLLRCFLLRSYILFKPPQTVLLLVFYCNISTYHIYLFWYYPQLYITILPYYKL